MARGYDAFEEWIVAALKGTRRTADRFRETIKPFSSPLGKPHSREEAFSGSYGQDEFQSAMDELDDFLSGEAPPRRNPSGGRRAEPRRAARRIPAEVMKDLAFLGLSPDTSEEEIRRTFRRLMAQHHPDRHSQDPEAQKAATEKSQRIGEAFQRISAWYAQNRG